GRGGGARVAVGTEGRHGAVAVHGADAGDGDGDEACGAGLGEPRCVVHAAATRAAQRQGGGPRGGRGFARGRGDARRGVERGALVAGARGAAEEQQRGWAMRRRAFTLLEALLAIALVAMLAGSVFGFMWTLLGGKETLRRRGMDGQAAGAFIERLEADL